MQNQMPVDQDITILGKVTTAFGIKGWVKVYSYTDPMTNILDFSSWLLRVNGQWREYKVVNSQLQTKGLAVALEGVNDRDAALALSQVEIAVPTSELPELEEDEYYWFQLEGLNVVNTAGQLLGQVKELFDSGGGNQVLVVDSCEGSVDRQQRLIPYADSIVLEVDLEGGEIQVDWEADF
ncbi:ribosome maturation factor RimM [Thalassolituus sp. LLYu03]|uniref:ribosome maturation factor RimM n=1 Tax=Thalassolituus sp. LLYu03 TaxID=3421656 RepID=UPI003D2AB0DF